MTNDSAAWIPRQARVDRVLNRYFGDDKTGAEIVKIDQVGSVFKPMP